MFDTILVSFEWQALYMRIHKHPCFPNRLRQHIKPPSWIAQLGGFLGGKSDGEPGIVAIWCDWLRLQDFAAAWELIVNERTLLVGNR